MGQQYLSPQQGRVPILSLWDRQPDVFQSISYRFITDVNTSIKSTDFLRGNSIMIIDPQSGYLARLIASGGEF